MKITYIGHSGFMVELEDKVLLFDYYKGEIPRVDKPLYVFVTHKHGDHYNRDILNLRNVWGKVTYIFSGDILTGKKAQEQGIFRVIANKSYELDDLKMETLLSNDEGVAFLIHTNGKTIYHAGDLNWWHWEGDPEEDNRFMEHTYKEEIGRLEHQKIDVAFVVLDPRQEEQFFWGFDWFMRNTDTKYVIPIHMWDAYEWIGKLCEMPESESYRERICFYNKSGDVIELKKE